MKLFKILIINILLFPVMLQAQECLEEFPESRYYRASGSGPNEEEARVKAMANLIGQFPSNFSVRKQQSETETNGQVSGVYKAQTEVQSQLRLLGVQYRKCESRRRRAKEVEVVAYISRQDLDRSAQEVGRKVREYLDQMEEKRGTGGIEEAIMAYLYTHLSPKVISEKADGRNRDDIQAYLESFLRNQLAAIKLRCLRVSTDPSYATQYTLNLSPEGSSPGADIGVEIPAYNAKGKIPHDGGPFGLIMQPASRTETMKAFISLEPRVLPDELRGISALSRISRELTITADFSNIIRISIKREDQGDAWKYSSDIQGLSIRQWEWLVDGQVRTLQPILVMPKREPFSVIRLRINGDDELTGEYGNSQLPPRKQEVRVDSKPVESEPPKPQPLQQSSPPPGSNQPAARTVEHRLANVPESILEIAGTQSTEQLEKILGGLQKNGKLLIGKKTDFMQPENCWVLIVNPGSAGVRYLLSPDAGGRKDLRTSRVFSNFEAEISREPEGTAVIWIETYR